MLETCLQNHILILPLIAISFIIICEVIKVYEVKYFVFGYKLFSFRFIMYFSMSLGNLDWKRK